MATTPGYHGYSNTLGDSNDTVFDTDVAKHTKPIRGIQIWCTGFDAEISLDPTNRYGSAENVATIIAGEAPVEFFAEQTFNKILARNRVSGSNAVLFWRTIYT